MKILLIADHEERVLWDHWSEHIAERLSDVSLILSAGDLKAEYLEFLVTMLNVPLVYVRGNHDRDYDRRPPEGCISAEGRIVEVECRDRHASRIRHAGNTGEAEAVIEASEEASAETSGKAAGEASEKDAVSKEAAKTIKILGLGGSMRYNPGVSDMYTEKEMRRRLITLPGALLMSNWGRFSMTHLLTHKKKSQREPSPITHFDILLTHAPCRGYGDMDDLPHTGFECFNALLDRCRPKLHVYGHVHKEYGNFHRTLQHPSGTTLINACGYYIIDMP